MFLWGDGGPVPKRNLLRIYKGLLKTAKIPDMRFHDLRHTVGTQLMKNGENAKVVASLLGHFNIRTTLQFYSHASEDLTAAAAHRMGTLLEPETADTVAEV